MLNTGIVKKDVESMNALIKNMLDYYVNVAETTKKYNWSFEEELKNEGKISVLSDLISYMKMKDKDFSFIFHNFAREIMKIEKKNNKK